MSPEAERHGVVPVIACGGSIESRIGENGLKEVTGDIGGLVEAAASVAGIPALVHRFARRTSYSLDVDDLIALALLARRIAAGERAVVTCGTDLLEEVAFALDVLAPSAGVVVTGAAGDGSPTSDGMPNLGVALQAARSPELPPGCAYVAFAGALRLGRDTVETDAARDPFRDSPRPPVGSWSDGALRVSSASRCLPLPPTAIPARACRVLLVASHAALDPGSLDLERPPVVVVQGFGAGNVPPPLAARLEERLERNAPVILCSAAAAIPVRGVSADAGGGARLVEHGAISAGSLTPRKACLLAALCFQRGADEGRRGFTRVVEALEA